MLRAVCPLPRPAGYLGSQGKEATWQFDHQYLVKLSGIHDKRSLDPLIFGSEIEQRINLMDRRGLWPVASGRFANPVGLPLARQNRVPWEQLGTSLTSLTSLSRFAVQLLPKSDEILGSPTVQFDSLSPHHPSPSPKSGRPIGVWRSHHDHDHHDIHVVLSSASPPLLDSLPGAVDAAATLLIAQHGRRPSPPA